jgi:putative spermidine/putrescine transport system permease protein
MTRIWRTGRSSPGLLLALSPAVIYLSIIYVFPFLRLLLFSVFDPDFTLQHYRHLVDVPVYRAVMLNTFEISITVAVLCLLLAYPTAYILVTAPTWLARILVGFVMLPFLASALVRNYAWIFLLGSRGVVNATLMRWGLISEPLPLIFNRTGVLIGMVNVLLPYMILVLMSVMRGIRQDLLVAAQSLMASPFTAFRRVFLPLSLPGVGASTLLVFVLGLAFFITPAMLGGQHDVMMANIIASVTGTLDWGFAGALIGMLFGASLVAIALMQYLFGGVGLIAGDGGAGLRPMQARGGREGPVLWALDRALDPIWPYLFPVIAGAVFVFLIVPVIIIVPLSFSSATFFVFPPPGFSLRWYANYLSAPGWLDSTWHSVEIGVLTTIFALSMGIPAALGLSRSASKAGSSLYLLLLSPLIMPSIVVAVGVFYVLTNLGLNYTVLGVALGHTIVSMPIAILVLVAALRNFDRNLERAAISLGASPLRTTLRITLPVLSTAVFTAALFAFLQSFDELLISLFVSGINARTLPKKMWESLQELDPTIAAVSTLLVIFLIVAMSALWLVQRYGQRRMRQLAT